MSATTSIQQTGSFDVLLDNLEGVVTQGRLLRNHPAIDFQAAMQDMMSQISNQIGTLSTKIDRLEGKVDSNHREATAKFAEIDRKIDEVDRKLTAHIGEVDRKLTAHIGEVDRKLTTQIADLDRKVDRLSTKVTNCDYNSMARVDNSGSTKRNAELTPLLDIDTGEPIPGFPATIGEADQVTGADAGRILRALGLSSHGTLEAKRDRMLMAIGVDGRPRSG